MSSAAHTFRDAYMAQRTALQAVFASAVELLSTRDDAAMAITIQQLQEAGYSLPPADQYNDDGVFVGALEDYYPDPVDINRQTYAVTIRHEFVYEILAASRAQAARIARDNLDMLQDGSGTIVGVEVSQ